MVDKECNGVSGASAVRGGEIDMDVGTGVKVRLETFLTDNVSAGSGGGSVRGSPGATRAGVGTPAH